MNVKRCFIDVILKNHRAIRAYQKAGLRATKTFEDNGIACQRMEIEKQGKITDGK
jgi:RimJ/RimL family protein N-acetyltransferase